MSRGGFTLLLRKLASVFRQQYIGALALFIALGGSAYAAATINSSNVVDNSLTSADIKGRAATKGKPFTQGTITGADVLGSPARPGHKAVNGGLTGADIANGSITSADIFSRTTVPNSAKLGGVLASGYGQTVRTGHQATSECDDGSKYNQCAPVTVTVPAGKRYRATVVSSLSAETYDSGGASVYYCPAVKSATLALTCLTGTPPPGGDYLYLAQYQSGSGAATGDTTALGFDLGQGTWTFSTEIYTYGVELAAGPWTAHTTVAVTNASAPGPSGVSGTDGTSGTCGSSSGSSGGTSGGTSGNTSGGTSGNTSGGTSSGSSGGTSGGTSGNTSGGSSSGSSGSGPSC